MPNKCRCGGRIVPTWMVWDEKISGSLPVIGREDPRTFRCLRCGRSLKQRPRLPASRSSKSKKPKPMTLRDYLWNYWNDVKTSRSQS